jgi:hypothetical protein
MPNQANLGGMPPIPGQRNHFHKALDCGLNHRRKPEPAWLDSRREIGQGYIMMTMLTLD